ncbi:MAG: DNA translocase FtsK [Candidatus Neoclostridium sp.]
MKKGTKVREEKFNITWEDLNGSFDIEDLLKEMANDMSENLELIVRFTKDEKGKVQVKYCLRSALNIDKMSKKALENLLEEYQEKLSDLEDEEPDKDDVKAYEKREDEVGETEEIISEIEERLEALDEKAAKNSIDSQKPKTEDCTEKKYAEFFNVAKSVLIDNADEKQLINYLDNNKDIKERVVFICDLIEKNDVVSISMLQRCTSVGYRKAAQIVDGLESIGVSTPLNGLNGRKVVKEQLDKLRIYLN